MNALSLESIFKLKLFGFEWKASLTKCCHGSTSHIVIFLAAFIYIFVLTHFSKSSVRIDVRLTLSHLTHTNVRFMKDMCLLILILFYLCIRLINLQQWIRIAHFFKLWHCKQNKSVRENVLLNEYQSNFTYLWKIESASHVISNSKIGNLKHVPHQISKVSSRIFVIFKLLTYLSHTISYLWGILILFQYGSLLAIITGNAIYCIK